MSARNRILLLTLTLAGGFATLDRVSSVRPSGTLTMPLPLSEARLQSISRETNNISAKKITLASLVARWREEDEGAAKEQLQAEIEAITTADTARFVLELLNSDFRADTLILRVLVEWSETAPLEALAWAKTSTTQSTQQIQALVNACSMRDFADLRAAIDAEPQGEWKHLLLTAATRAALQADSPEIAAMWMKQIPSERHVDDLLDQLAREWGKKDFAATTGWILSQEDAVQDRLLAVMLGGYASTRPDAAAALARSIFPSGEPLSRAAELIVPVWARVDIRAAADWITTFPESESRQRAFDLLLPTWLARDESAVRQWLLALPAASSRSEALDRFVQWGLQNSPQTAADLLAQVSSDDMRPAARIGIVRQLARWDSAKAHTWVAQLPVGRFRAEALNALKDVAGERPDIPY